MKCVIALPYYLSNTIIIRDIKWSSLGGEAGSRESATPWETRERRTRFRTPVCGRSLLDSLQSIKRAHSTERKDSLKILHLFVDMDTFYGKMLAVRIPDGDSEESDLYDGDDIGPKAIYAPDSVFEEPEDFQDDAEEVVIHPTYSSDDSIPLSVIPMEILKKISNSRWLLLDRR
ncbi:hypothetical protein JTB14_028516 [Gonioctena quinquepunctata]|nr:hypothetical protein JTB14_028516 [Gonioctena quinquepunctata]